MSYRYRCGTCRETTPPLPSLRSAHAVRGRHRSAVHGGLIPDAEELWSDTGLSIPARRLLIGLTVGGAALGVANWLTR